MNRKNWRTAQQRGYTLIEILIVLAVLAASVVGVMRLYGWASVRADTQREQTSIAALVKAVQGVYATAPSYQGIGMGIIQEQARLDEVLRAGGVPVSAFGGALTLNAATVSTPDDAFGVRISQLNTKDCVAIIPALAGQSAQVFTASSGNIQTRPNQVPNGAAIATACAGGFFQKGQGAVTLVYYSPRATAAAASSGPACATSCSPQTQTQTLACPTGQSGEINQTRSSTCSTGACPSPVWSAWTSTSSSCASAPIAPPPPPVALPPPGAPCAPHIFTRTLGCPLPEVGGITQQQAITCAGGTQQVGAWTTTSSTCAAPPLPCVSGALTGVDACPAGEGGQVSWFQNMTCGGGGLIIGPKTPTGSSCSPACQARGTCCRPSTTPDGQKTVACAAGQYGQIIQALKKSSTCSSATAIPIWGPDQVVSATGACAACPVPTTENQTIACPAGQVGSITQSRGVSYACGGAPTTLPAPTYGAWTTTSNTCVVAGCVPYGNGVAGGITVTPVNLTLSTSGSQGAVLGAYGSTSVAAAPTGSATFKLAYGGDSTTVNVSCTGANNTSGGSVSCVGPNTRVTVGGATFLAYFQTNGPFLDQGKYWDATIQVNQNCRHWQIAGTEVVQTNVMNNTTPVSGKGTDAPTESDVSSSGGPITWVIPANDRIGSGDGPFDPTGTKIYPWENYLNLMGQVKTVAWAPGYTNPGYGTPTNPWASMYASGNYKVYAGPTASSYAGVPADCTAGTNLLFATQWNYGSYPMQLLYDGFSCIVGQVTTFAAPSGSPAPPANPCPLSASEKPIGHNSSPMLAAPCH